MKHSVRAAIIQFDCPPNKEESIQRIAALAREAAAGADLVLLAETAFTPYTTVDDFRPLAEPIPGPFSDLLCGLAREKKIHLCCGTIEADGSKVYNTALLISPEGRILHRHRKVNLASIDMSAGFSPGTEIRAVDTALGRIGILICLDTDDRSLIVSMAQQTPDIILVPAYGLAKADYRRPERIDGMLDECIDEWRMRMQMLAKFCKAWVLRADHCGIEERQMRVGHALAVTRGGYVISEASMRPAILRCELDPGSPAQRSW
jgi:predicted amidohydrolase